MEVGMARYMIKNLRSDAFGLGPDGSLAVAEAELQDENGNVFFLSLNEFSGIPSFFKTEESTFEKQCEYPSDDEEFFEFLGEHEIGGYSEYGELFEDKDGEWYAPLHFMVYVLCGCEDVDAYLAEVKGKFIDELDVPKTELEEDWEADQED